MTITMFDEDYGPEGERSGVAGESPDVSDGSHDNNTEPESEKEDSGDETKSGGFPFASLLAIAAAAGVVLLVGLAFWWLLFAPTPSTNVQDAASIIEQDISTTMNTAEAFTVSNSSDASTLTVETEEGTCKVFRSLDNGSYQAIESEGRLDTHLMRFLPLNYHRAYPSNEHDDDSAFEYYHSPEQLQHGVYVNLSIGDNNPNSDAAVNISGDYGANMNTTDESFCF